MAKYHLHCWSVQNNASPYTAPEDIQQYLVGIRNKDMVQTSPFIKANGREVTTMSGSIYILEDIDPKYLQWLYDNGFNYDLNNPLKIKGNK